MASTTTASTMSPTDARYLESIQDPFFKSMAEQAIPALPPSSDEPTSVAAAASTRLEGLEMAIRKQLFQMVVDLQQKKATDEEVVQTVGTFWKSTLDVCHHLVHHSSQDDEESSTSSDARYKDMNARRLPVLLISDCLDALPSVSACQKFWSDFVQPALDSVLFGDLFWRDAKAVCHLPFLKVCNQFLKTLETSSDIAVEWKGRIMWDLAKGFSIADKSAMKLWGSFNTKNTTQFETETEFGDQGDQKLAVSSSTADSSVSPVDYSLYEAFWSLQSDFANPNRIQVGDFIKKLRLVLAALESASSTSSNAPAVDATSTTTTQKYLTSSALLPSQLADPGFRSSVLTQFLIVASHLSSESPPLKNALSSFLTRACKLLQKDNPDLYELVWDGILANGRENDWRQWKKQKCVAKAFEPQYKRKDVNDDGSPKRKKIRLMDGPIGGNEGGAPSEDQYKFIGLEELKKISKESRDKIPTLEQHLEPYVDALDPESGIEDEYHPKNDSVFTWRAMRLYSKHELPFLSNCRRPADLERITRQLYQSKGQEIPGEMPPETRGLSEDEEDGDKGESKKEEEEENASMKEENDEDGDASQDGSQDEDVEMGDAEESEQDDKSPMAPGESQSRSPSQSQPASEDEKEADGAAEGDAMEVEDDKKTEEPATTESEEPEEKPSALETVKEEENENNEADDGKDDDVEDEKEASVEMKVTSSDAKDKSAATRKKTTKAPAKKPEPVSTAKPQDKKGGRRGRNRGPSPRNTPAPRGGDGGGNDNPRSQPRGGRRGNEGGRDRRDDGPPGRRGRNDEPPPPSRGRGGGRPGGESPPHRGGRGGGPPPRGGRYDDDYRGDGRQQSGGGRGDRYGRGPSGDRGPGPDRSPRDDRGGRSGRDDYHPGDRGGDGRRGDGGRPSRGGRRDRRR